MAALGSQSIASSYEQLLHVDANGGGNGTTHVSIKDGDNGTTFGFTIATDALMMTGTNRLEFGDTGTYIHQSADGVLDLVSDTELELNATTIEMNGAVKIVGSGATDHVLIENTNTGADNAPDLVLYRNSSSPADSDSIGRLEFRGRNDNTEDITYANLEGVIIDASDGAESSRLLQSIMKGGSSVIGFKSDNTEFAINESGVDMDFRVEAASSNTHALFVQGSSGNVGIGDSDPSEAKLSIDNVASGDIGLQVVQAQAEPGIFIDQNGNNRGLKVESTGSNNGAALFNSNCGSSTVDPLVKMEIENSAFDQPVLHIVNAGTSYALEIDANGTERGLYLDQAGNAAGAEVHSRHASFTNNSYHAKTTRTASADFAFFRGTSDAFSSPDVEVALKGDGVIQGDQAYATGASDYAEYFESKDGSAIPIGTTVKLDNGKIVACEDGDTPIGAIRPEGTVSVLGNSAWNKWTQKYLKTDYGEYIYEEYTMTEWKEDSDKIKTEAVEKVLYAEGDEIPEGKEIGDIKTEAIAAIYEQTEHQYQTDKIPSDVKVPSDAIVISAQEDGKKLMRKKINPDYDESKTYVPREERDEWNIVGLLGQIEITKGQPMASNWIKMKDVSDTVEMWFVK